MVKPLLALALLGSLGWFVYQELEIGKVDAPTSPSVQYPVVDAGGGPGGVGEGTNDLLGN